MQHMGGMSSGVAPESVDKWKLDCIKYGCRDVQQIGIYGPLFSLISSSLQAGERFVLGGVLYPYSLQVTTGAGGIITANN